LNSFSKKGIIIIKWRMKTFRLGVYSGSGFGGLTLPLFLEFLLQFTGVFWEKNPKTPQNFRFHTKKIQTPLENFLDTPLPLFMGTYKNYWNSFRTFFGSYLVYNILIRSNGGRCISIPFLKKTGPNKKILFEFQKHRYFFNSF